MPRTNEIDSGRRLSIDATNKMAGEGFKRAWPPPIEINQAVKAQVEKLIGSTKEEV